MEIRLSGSNHLLFMNGKNGGYIFGRFIGKNEKLILSFGDEVRLPGVTIIWLESIIYIISDLPCITNILPIQKIPEEILLLKEKREIFLPSPKTFLNIDNDEVELDAPPQKRNDEKHSAFTTVGPAFTMAIPMLVGFAFTLANKGAGKSAFMYTGLVTAVMSAILGSFWAYMNIKNRNLEIQREERKRKEAYREYVNSCEKIIGEKYLKNRNALKAMAPEISDVICRRKESREVFSVNPDEGNAFKVRLGTGSERFPVEIITPKEKFEAVPDELKKLPGMLKQKYSEMKDVPVCIDFREKNPVGIIGDSETPELISLIILSLASRIIPEKLKIALILLNRKDDFWRNGLLFLPHIWGKEGHLFANSIDRARVILSSDLQCSYMVIITDSYDEIKEYRKENRLFIILSDDFYKLPCDCHSIIQKDSRFCGYIEFTSGRVVRRNIDFDVIREEEFRQGAVFISQLCESIEASNKEIPERADFLEVITAAGLTDYKPDSIYRKWKENNTYSQIKIPIRFTANKEVLFIDFHEKGMGPHGLIAGMTGSGKSEILQTIILSLALYYSPDEIGFFLIDYKGGGMAGLFEGIPHVLGSVSNLSGSMVSRAMVSIRGENERRQIIFNKTGVNNIYEYGKLFREGKVDKALPHIFIIVDEFAELKRECPDFMRELISVARVGRSLGIHLILATQKPSGTVDDDILSNSRYRICLRVQDRQDSNEILHTYDAADITNPGRAILQVGNNEIYKYFQSAYTMASVRTNSNIKRIFRLDEYGRTIDDNREEDTGISSLSYISSVIKETATYYKDNRDRFWLKPLPEKIYYEKEWDKKIIIGVYDDPANQRRGLLTYDYEGDGHLLVLGGIGTGKSTLLQNLIISHIRKYSGNECNIYLLDFNAYKLSIFRESVMCGGYFSEDNIKDIAKLFIMINKEISSRKRRYIGEVKQQIKKPAMLIAIDGIGSFRELTGGTYDKDLINILKNGENTGVYLIISALSISTVELPARLFEHFKTVYTLSLSEKYRYQESLRVSGDKIIVHEDTRGRGLFKLEGELYEYQAIFPVLKDEEMSINEYLLKVIQEKNKIDTGVGVKKVPIIPLRPVLEDLLNSVKNSDLSEYSNFIPCGYMAESGEVYIISLEKCKNYIVSGRSGSGKSNFLRVISSVAREYGYSYRENKNMDFENLIIYSNEIEVAFYVYDEGLSLSDGARLKEIAGKDYGLIHFGGSLDRQSLADFSYIPYLKQVVQKESGMATILRQSEEEFYGDIVIPRCK